MKFWKTLTRNHHGGTKTDTLQRNSPTLSDDSGQHSVATQSSSECAQGGFYTIVELRKKHGESLGIILSGISDVGCPSISSLRNGSVAQKSDQLVSGDRVHSVNGINTARMKHEDISNLLENVDETALLEIEYAMPNYNSQNSLCAITRIANVPVEKAEGSLGITLRGGLQSDPLLNRPLTVTHVRPNGPAHRSGRIKIGDRILQVDGQSLQERSLLEAQHLLQEALSSPDTGPSTVLTIEYDISIVESVRHAAGPLLIEVERRPHEELGLVLSNYQCEQQSSLQSGQALPIFVHGVVAASVADRCGALHLGDQLLAVDDTYLEGSSATPSEVMRLLQKLPGNGYTRLQILPCHITKKQYNWIDNHGSGFSGVPGSPSPSGFSTMASRRTKYRNTRNYRESSLLKHYDSESATSNYCGYSPQLGVCHPEMVTVALNPDASGYGLKVGIENCAGEQANIVITQIVLGSPAYKCGCLQTGDRILSVNHQNSLTVQEVDSLLNLGNGNPNSTPKLALQVEFDVADSIVPSSGVFTVRIARRGPDLGITITASKSVCDDPFVISDVRRGSVAHRTGSLRVGDRLLAVDGRPLDKVAVESGVLDPPANSEIVTLKVQKAEQEISELEFEKEEEGFDEIVYTVEVTRNGGPLGVTISGSEECSEPIVLSRLTAGGVAERTGALHVGDKILAIDGENICGRALSEAVRLLQSAGDTVQIKISRPNAAQTQENAGCGSSAAESWDSGVQPDSNKRSEKRTTLCSYSDAAADDSACPSPLPLPLPLPDYSFTNTLSSPGRGYQLCARLQEAAYNDRYEVGSLDDLCEVHQVTLYKDTVYDDYGFSVSDGLYERGVYINRIRRGGPAHLAGTLRPYDRILQVNETKTQDFDCCLTVPLIASAGDKIELMVSRNPYVNYPEDKEIAAMSWSPVQQEITSYTPKNLSSSQNTITKTL